MDITYKVVGSDGQEYGPILLADLKSWVKDGRVLASTMVFRSDQTAWTTAASLPELNLQDHASPPSLPSASADDPALVSQLRSGASWFYWIAGLSLINSLVAFSGSDWGFVLGLGITRIFDAVGNQMGSVGKMVTLGMNLVAIAVFVMFGVFANKKHTWAFIVGMILYALDGLIFLLAMDFLGIGFHAFALFCIFKGFQACRNLKTE